MAVKETTATPLLTSANPGWKVTLAFVIFVFLIGGASVTIRITYQELAPFSVATARFGLVALIFWGIAAVKKTPIPKENALLGAVLYGVFGSGLSFVLMAWGLTETPASLYQILMALIPLATIFLSALQGLESITARSIFGTLLAIVGIIIVVGGSGATQNSTWMAFIFLVLFVTVIAFLLYMFVLGKWSASRTSYGFVLTPLVTVLVASVFTNEAITMNFVLGAVFVLTGVYVGALMNGKKVVAQEECKDRSGQTLPRCV